MHARPWAVLKARIPLHRASPRRPVDCSSADHPRREGVSPPCAFLCRPPPPARASGPTRGVDDPDCGSYSCSYSGSGCGCGCGPPCCPSATSHAPRHASPRGTTGARRTQARVPGTASARTTPRAGSGTASPGRRVHATGPRRRNCRGMRGGPSGHRDRAASGEAGRAASVGAPGRAWVGAQGSRGRRTKQRLWLQRTRLCE